MNTQQTAQAHSQPDNWEDLTEAQQDTWMRAHASTGEHSPLPWTMDETPLDSPSGQKYISNAVTANGKLVGKLTGFSGANAAFIVRACNNTQRLADALADIATGEHPDEAPKKAREALAEWEKDNQ